MRRRVEVSVIFGLTLCPVSYQFVLIAIKERYKKMLTGDIGYGM